jgi:hypothetical protein
MPHLAYSMMLAILLSCALALLGRRSLRERLCVAGYTFLCCAFATVAGSWCMFLIHG